MVKGGRHLLPVLFFYIKEGGELMKRLFVICCLLLSCMLPVNAYATEQTTEETTEQTTENSGYVTSGSASWNWFDDYSEKNNQNFYSFNVAATSDDSIMYLLRLRKCNDNPQSGYSYVLKGKGSFSVSVNNYYVSPHGDKVILSNGSSDYEYSAFQDIVSISDYSNNISTKLPIFDYLDEESINKYVDTGDTSGAENQSDLDLPVDESIEKPSNLRSYGKLAWLVEHVAQNNNQLTARWDASDTAVEGYSYDLQMKFSYIVGGNRVDGDWKSYVSDYPYNAKDLVDINTGEPVQRSSSMPEDFVITQAMFKSYAGISDKDWTDYWLGTASTGNITGSKSYSLLSCTVRVRNRSGNNCSNWVQATVESDKATAVVTDQDGNVIPDDEYNGQDVDNTNHNTYYDTDADYYNNVNADELSINSIMSYIKNGFGLLGNDGLLALMANTFAYLPKSLWTILNFFVSIMVVLAIIGAIKSFVF